MDNTPFGRLPRELRDRIYEYAVVHPHGLKMRQYSSMHGKTKMPCRVVRTSSSKNATIALAKTCKQLHAETIDLYYKLNAFQFPFDWKGVELLKHFSSALKPKYYDMLQHIVFRAPSQQIFWEEKYTDRLMGQWFEVTHQIVDNAAKLLPGPVYVSGHFSFDCSPDKTRPRGHFDLDLDMNRIQGSMQENWDRACELDSHHSYGMEGTALFHLFGEMEALMGNFGSDHEEGGEQKHEDDGDAGQDGDERSNISEADEHERLLETDHTSYTDDNNDDDDPEYGKMAGALSYGDRYFAMSSGLRF